jgi:uncharacterized protein
VGTDLFHIFAKAIMGSVLHRKLGNISACRWRSPFLIGAIGGATLGGMLNRYLYDLNPVLSDMFITTVYVFMLGFLSFYAMTDYLRRARDRAPTATRHGGRSEGPTRRWASCRRSTSRRCSPSTRRGHPRGPSHLRDGS